MRLNPARAPLFHSLPAMVLAAFGLRLATMAIFHTYRINIASDPFRYGGAMATVAYAIVSGQGFSSPYLVPTGPTAVVPPVYPYLLAAVFRLFGSYTAASAAAIFAINSVFAALTCVTVVLAARKVFDETLADWAGWTWALFPYFLYWPIKMIWETSLSAFLLSALFLLTLHLEQTDRARVWAGFGLLWGVAALTNPALLAFLPFAMAWLWHRRRQQRTPAAGTLRNFALAGLLALLLVAPWLVRNYRAFGQPVFLRSNFGLEFRLGNYEGAAGLRMPWPHPAFTKSEFVKYARMGEIAYMAERREQAWNFVREHPGTFLATTLKRVFYYWAGTPEADGRGRLSFGWLRHFLFLASSVFAFWGLGRMIQRRKPAAFLFAAVLLAFPLTYYVTYPTPRYRHPIEPVMLLLVVYLFSGMARESRERRGGA